MKPFQPKLTATSGFGGIIERIEILRSTLRWAPRLERQDIQKLLKQVNELRDTVMVLSRTGRLPGAGDEAELEPLETLKKPAKKSNRERRQALVERNFVFEGVFGDSPKLLEAMEIAERAAPSDLPVLIEGASGTGKELMAKVVHANGRRADKPFVSVNCGAIPDSLLESELFGHRKGAFTGASSDRKGKFESADGGTIFLDEVGELPLQGQVKLLRVLQSNEIQRVGSDHPIVVDTRIVAATNRDLLEMAHQGQFREDLYYRLGVIHVQVPALRERTDEIPLLIDYFVGEAADSLGRKPVRLSPRLRTFLLGYPYPGNIRELRNIVFRISCLADDVADTHHLPEAIRPGGLTENATVSAAFTPSGVSLAEAKKAASDEAEKQFLVQGLQEVKGTVSELAKRVGMNRSHLQTLLKKHDIHSKDFKAAPPAPSRRKTR
ncbi:MAG: sigma-54 dependent transcriptional regulator [Gammaproteobacteria bacterium]|jgi:transcriptional regulator with GAF, ATPase, and Fis domain